MQTELYRRRREDADWREPFPSGGPRNQIGTVPRQTAPCVGLLTGGQDRHYAVGLATALMEQDVALDVIGSDEIDGPEFHANARARFLNLHGSGQSASLPRRIGRLLVFYSNLFQYTLTAKPRIFHILWNNKLQLFDRTLLMLFYKAAGKRLILTAHNVNAGRRDRNDSWLNRITLSCQYTLVDHILVHTNKMKDELVHEFGVAQNKVTVIPYGINNAVPISELTSREARRKLGLRNVQKVILYFGAIKQYKGLEDLVAAFQRITAKGDYQLIIAGERKKGHEQYWRSIQQMLECDPNQDKVLQKIEFIADPEIEIYFKAADVAVLPYTEIFQSGILFLAYAYGLPVIATDVGSFAEDVVEGRTGFICSPRDPAALATTIERYFETDLYRELEDQRKKIQEYALARHSWSAVANLTRSVYSKLLECGS